MNCQALIPGGDGTLERCSNPRHDTWGLTLRGLTVALDLCAAHNELLELDDEPLVAHDHNHNPEPQPPA
jgi:hypothetical protein